MKSSTHLDSIAFQLTPTRTRCDLVITANGKTEKIASGLLDPFVAHLKAAQEQIGKGGYSIVLEPIRGSDTPWFTKGTVERFVCFVSTPEILERAYTIESEILQIEKAISRQSRNGTVLCNVVDIPVKSEETLEGSKPAVGGNEEKAIVLYQPANHEAAEDESTVLEKNSKVQLVQVLETRKSVLQKEQGMAFARAVVARFDINNIAALLAFAECFGASRMMDACQKFVHLWKAKQESGQWVEIEATEAMSCPAEVPSTNSPGIVFHSSNISSPGGAAAEKNGKSDHNHQTQQNPLFVPWQMNSQSNGMPIFHPYPMQGIPYYQNYPGNNTFSQSPYSPVDVHPGQRTRWRRHSVDNGDASAESEDQETDTDEEVFTTKSRMKKSGKSSKKRDGKVVIRNINYISSTKQGSDNSDAKSSSNSGTNDDGGHMKGDERRKSGKKSSTGDGHWKAFQNFLLTDADESINSVNDMFAMEGRVQGRKRQTVTAEPSMSGSKDVYGNATYLRHDRVGDGQTEHLGEAECQRRAYRRHADTDMDYMFNRQEKKDIADTSLGYVISNGFQGLAHNSNDNNRGSLPAVTDESFVVLHRTGSSDQRAGIDMDYQLPSVLKKPDNNTVRTSQSNFEPNDLNLMPNRTMEDGLTGYDPAIDYEMQAQVNESTQQTCNSKKVSSSGTKQETKKTVKDQKKAEKIPASTRREKPSKFSPSDDARARAEKLRAYKADLQKLKMEKEEEQLKRLEALKIERQKRIAAKSGATVIQSPSSSQQARKQLPKFSPISQKGSKFSDTEPGSSSPLQRSTLKLVRKVSSDSSTTPKPGRSNSGSQLNENRLTRSASSLSVRNAEKNGLTPESKATMSRIRRLSQPKTTVHRVSSGMTRSAEAVSRRRVTEKNPINKEKPKNPSEKMLSTSPVTSNSNRGISKPLKDGDESTIVEKTVVMLEFKKPATPVFQQPENQPDTDNDVGGILEEDISVPPPASPIVVKEVECEPSGREVKRHSCTRLNVNESEGVSPNLPYGSTSEVPYQPPHARVSSTEDPCMNESEYGKAVPTGFLTAIASIQTTTALSDGQREDSVKIPQAVSGKHQGKESKESPKGFRRLLKFGKRSSAASESNIEFDKSHGSGTGDNTLNGSSSEVFTLKNLLNQEESSTAATPTKKSSRSFSLLSAFKSKNPDKKATS